MSNNITEQDLINAICKKCNDFAFVTGLHTANVAYVPKKWSLIISCDKWKVVDKKYILMDQITVFFKDFTHDNIFVNYMENPSDEMVSVKPPEPIKNDRLPIEDTIDIIRELIRLTKSGKIHWDIERASNEDKAWYTHDPDKYWTTTNGTSFKMFAGFHGGGFWINDVRVLDREVNDNPTEYHNYLRSLNCNPFKQLQAIIEGTPSVDIIQLNSLLDGLKNT